MWYTDWRQAGGREAEANMEETDGERLPWVEAYNSWPSRKTLKKGAPGDQMWDLLCLQLASYPEGGPLHLHFNQNLITMIWYTFIILFDTVPQWRCPHTIVYQSKEGFLHLKVHTVHLYKYKLFKKSCSLSALNLSGVSSTDWKYKSHLKAVTN